MKLKITRPDGAEEEIEVSAYESLEPVESQEAAIEDEFMPLNISEKAIDKRNGQAQIKVIQAGWGSSGYYSKEMLKRDGPKAFKPGTKMFWDHQTSSEEAERPEGSLRNLAAELTSAAKWIEAGPQGPGLYAHAKVFEGFQGAVEQLAPHIGVSIRATGKARGGEAEGRKGALIEEIVAAKSIDFVTSPGAGGAVVQLFESARSGPQEDAPMELTEAKVQEMIAAATAPLQPALTEMQTNLETTETDNARLREGLLLRDAREFVATTLAPMRLMEAAKNRIVEKMAANPPIKEGALDRDAYKTAIEAAATAEAEYISNFSTSPIRNMGSSGLGESVTAEDAEKKLETVFAGLGLSEAAAKHAAAGRA